MIRIGIAIRLDTLKSDTNFVTTTLRNMAVYGRKNSSDPRGYHHDLDHSRYLFIVKKLSIIMFELEIKGFLNNLISNKFSYL